MKRKIVLWGANEKDEKILVALELLDNENKVNLYTFNQDVATEEFYNSMLKEWRENKELVFPAHQKTERQLSISEQILPENIKVDRPDIVSRAQAEWHFVVLSSKLYQMYKSEVEDLSETIESMMKYDNGVWNDLKNFWSKVQDQVYEKNLFREHASSLKSKTNELFDKLKSMKKELDKELNEVSGKHKETVMTELADIEARVEKGLGLKPIFEELKQLQTRIKNMDFNGKHRRQVWDKIDAAFKIVKEKRFGASGSSNRVPEDRHSRRLNGLNEAISKMERSIKRDKDDQAWQAKRANNTDGQLEMQIRQAKIKMIDERVKSKEEKLADMLKTRIELEGRVEKEKAKAAKRAEQDAINKAKAEAANAAKAKIAADIVAKNEAMSGDTEKLEKAASQIAESKAKKVIAPVELPSEETAEKVDADSKTEEPKAADTNANDVKEEVAEAIANVEEKIEEVKEAASSIFDSIAITVGDAIEDVIDTVKAVAEVVEDKIEDAVANVKSEEEE